MDYEGVLIKMPAQLDDTIQYFLNFEQDVLHMNQLIGREISISFVRYQCLNCGKDKKIFRQGFCYDCFYEIPQAADWVMRPELSKAHLGQEDRDLEYEKKVQLQPHIVYLANSSNVKVGVTRKSQVPTRWIDQGAHEAMEILEVPNRYLAGVAEVALKEHVSDKTNWRTMLKNDLKDEDLAEWRDRLKEFVPEETKEYFLDNNTETHMNFPVNNYPEKIASLNLEKTPAFEGTLEGIKGQYLLLSDNRVFNLRGHEGYVIRLGIHSGKANTKEA